MNILQRRSKGKLPQYVLVDRLPSSVGPRLLGRIVLDIQSPIDQFRPEDPSKDLSNETLEIVDSNFSTLFSINRNATVEAKIGQIVGVAVDDTRSVEKKFEGKTIRTRFLAQHKDALRKLLEKRRGEIIELLSDAKKGKGYMIVGFKTAADASMSSKEVAQRTTKLGVEFPANQVAAAASHGAVQASDIANPQINISSTADAVVANSAQMVGEQIFAVRYRIVTLKRKHHRESVDYGDVKRVNVEDGVYGSEEKEPIFDEDDAFDGEGSSMWDDDDFEFSEESMKSEIKKMGLPAVIAKANE